MAIINSLLDSDLYKFSMGQAVLHSFPSAIVRYEFKCRTEGINLSSHVDEINKEINALCNLKFTPAEIKYLSSLKFLKEDFIEFLSIFSLRQKFIKCYVEDDELKIEIEGPWCHVIYFEVPILAIVNEIYFSHGDFNRHDKERIKGDKKLHDKISLVANNVDSNFKFADFGTRRRHSYEWQKYVIGELKFHLSKNFIGTSNVHFAHMYDLTPIGTMAHEWLCAGQALTRVSESQKFMLQKWADEYRGNLGIALSDTVGFDAFLNDFDMYFAKLFDGCRHDSGDPHEWCSRLIKHYEDMNIAAGTKTAVFSDGLNFEKAISLFKRFSHRIKTSFGIGTNLTNDLLRDPLQIVIKMTHCNGKPVAKISDSPGKEMCKDDEYLKYLTTQFGIKK